MDPLINLQKDRDSLDRQLSIIRSYIENEIAAKEATILQLRTQLLQLTDLIDQKNGQLELLQEKLAQSQQNIEGQRQLMNKLLNDIGNYQRDILWYRRTYQQRSLIGILKDKLLGKSSTDANDNG